MTGAGVVLLTTFLASAVEAIEMVIIVLGVGAARGWRSALIGAAAGFGVLAVVIAVLNVALAAGPIRPPSWGVGPLAVLFARPGCGRGSARAGGGGCAGG